jgi:CRP-like cAMP-binding protein
MASAQDIWCQFPEDVKLAFKKVHKIKRYKRGEVLYRAGDFPQGAYFVASGLAGLTYSSNSGRETLLRLLKPGQFLGHRSLFAGEPYHGSAVLLETSEIHFIPKEEFFEILDRYPLAYRPMVQSLACELRQAELRIASMSDKDVTARVAETLIYLKNVYPEHQWTRREIADFCGSTTSTVIKVLSKLEGLEAIKQDGRAISILGLDTLLELAFQ